MILKIRWHALSKIAKQLLTLSILHICVLGYPAHDEMNGRTASDVRVI